MRLWIQVYGLLHVPTPLRWSAVGGSSPRSPPWSTCSVQEVTLSLLHLTILTRLELFIATWSHFPKAPIPCLPPSLLMCHLGGHQPGFELLGPQLAAATNLRSLHMTVALRKGGTMRRAWSAWCTLLLWRSNILGSRPCRRVYRL